MLIFVIGILTQSSAQVNIIPDSATICIGNTVQLNVAVASELFSCGVSTDICVGNSTQNTIGVPTGANTMSSWPAPYGNWYSNAKHQFYYTANELNTQGIFGGNISEIAWEVTQLQQTAIGNHGLYNNYTISIGCTTSASSTSTTFQTGLTTVYGPVDYPIVLGWNIHNFNNDFSWDGTLDLIVQVCYDWVAANNYSENCLTPWTTTTFNSSLYYYSDNTVACSSTSGSLSTKRPITRFNYCPSNPNNFSYSWTPSQGLSGTTIQNPIAFPSTTTMYYVTVTDSLGNIGMDSILVTVELCTNINKYDEFSDFNIFPNPSSGIFTITKSNNLNQPIEIKLVNTLGELIFKQAISKNQNSIDVDISSYNKGIYFLYLSIDNEQVVKKIIKY